MRFDQAARHHGYAKSRRHAAQHRLDGAEFQLAQAGNAAPGQQIFQFLAIRATGPQHDDAHIGQPGQPGQLGDAGRGHHHQFLGEDGFGDEVRMVDRAAHEGALQLPRHHLLDQFPAGAGA